MPYAHTKTRPDGSLAPPEEWEPLFTPFGEATNQCQGSDGAFCQQCQALSPSHGHLNKVASWCAKFAAEMFPPGPDREAARQWGWLAGLWHDLGKFAPEWQNYLRSKADPHQAEVTGKIDHSTAGAIHSHSFPPLGDLFSYLIAGHHAGLADAAYLFNERLKRPVHQWQSHAESAGIPLNLPLPMPPLSRPEAGNDAMAFMLRFFFSCLVDADFLATEAFMRPDQSGNREPWPTDIIDRMLGSLESHLLDKFGGAPSTPVNLARDNVRRSCIQAADHPTGFFSLTVPTGGGKTLSSLLFALLHAKRNGLRRVVYVIPFTSIIRQNADVFRDAFATLSRELGREIVLEHHSQYDPEKETTANRLATENWDAPLIVTTNVRFFESLFANRTSACRKLHRIARSVVIFDEAQALPAHLLAPILRGLRCLVHDLHGTAVLCTATQPALDLRSDFTIGIPPAEITPIIADEKTLFRTLERVESGNLGPLDDDALLDHISAHAPDGCLVIANTTKAAQTLHQKLRARNTGALHLSARMCPAHVMEVLDKAKQLRQSGNPVFLVATQLIEAGVDISFPVVYRAECGLDSFAQAAGRCNRNGEMKDAAGNPVPGHVYLFQSTDHPIPRMLADLVSAAAITRSHITPNFPPAELLSLAAVRAYFEQAIWQAGPRTDSWDNHHIVSGDMSCFPPQSHDLRSYNFKTAAERFRLIDSNTHTVLIPWGSAGGKLADAIHDLDRCKMPPRREHYRHAQQFTVQVYEHEWQHLQNRISLHCDEAFAILIHPENDYQPATGLKRPDAPDDPSAFCR